LAQRVGSTDLAGDALQDFGRRAGGLLHQTHVARNGRSGRATS
jgi:hypothetical protein